VRTASANGTALDTLGYQSVEWVVLAGDIDLTTGDETYAFKVQEATDSAFTTPVDISGATTTVTADNDTKVIRVDSLGTGSRLRYQRIVATLAGTTPSWPGAVFANFGRAYQNPVN
jgi:hypothetical protein